MLCTEVLKLQVGDTLHHSHILLGSPMGADSLLFSLSKLYYVPGNFAVNCIMSPEISNPSEIKSYYESLKKARGKEDIFCEIEDLIDENLIFEFARINHNVFKHQPKTVGSETHYTFKREIKRSLFKFVKSNAILSDVSRILQLIKFFRNYFLGDSEGVPHANKC